MDIFSTMLPLAMPHISKLFGKKEPTGQDLGDQAKDYYGSAFPGTTPWEQLGAGNPVGATQSASIGADNALKVKGAELSTQKSIAQANNKTQEKIASMNVQKDREVAGLQYGSDVMSDFAGRHLNPYDTNLKQQRELLNSQKLKLNMESKLVLEDIYLKRVVRTGENILNNTRLQESLVSEAMNKARLTNEQARIWLEGLKVIVTGASAVGMSRFMKSRPPSGGFMSGPYSGAERGAVNQ